MQTILIAQESDELGSTLAHMLQSKYHILRCNDGQTALEMILRYRPYGLISDLMLAQIDGLTVLRQAKHARPKHILVTTRQISSYIYQATNELGVGYVLHTPCAVTAIISHLEEMIHLEQEQMKAVLVPGNQVAAHLMRLGFDPKKDGFSQLRLAIPIFAQDRAQKICMELYPQVAQTLRYSDGAAVERSIRSAIQKAWTTGDSTIWQQYFPGQPSVLRKPPSNKRFISRIAEILSGN